MHPVGFVRVGIRPLGNATGRIDHTLMVRCHWSSFVLFCSVLNRIILRAFSSIRLRHFSDSTTCVDFHWIWKHWIFCTFAFVQTNVVLFLSFRFRLLLFNSLIPMEMCHKEMLSGFELFDHFRCICEIDVFVKTIYSNDYIKAYDEVDRSIDVVKINKT